MSNFNYIKNVKWITEIKDGYVKLFLSEEGIKNSVNCEINIRNDENNIYGIFKIDITLYYKGFETNEKYKIELNEIFKLTYDEEWSNILDEKKLEKYTNVNAEKFETIITTSKEIAFDSIINFSDYVKEEIEEQLEAIKHLNTKVKYNYI